MEEKKEIEEKEEIGVEKGERRPGRRGGKHDLRTLVSSALFVSLAYICVFVFNFKVGTFLTFDFKDAVMAVGALWLGPLYAVLMPLVVSLLEMVSISGTGFYGFLMNFLSSTTFCLTASLLFRIKRTRRAASLSMVASAFLTTAVMLICNLVVTPFYTGMTVAEVGAIVPTLLLPFNLIKTTVNAALTLLLYTPVRNAVKRTKLCPLGEESAKCPRWVMPAAALLICAGSLVLFFLVLGGEFRVWFAA